MTGRFTLRRTVILFALCCLLPPVPSAWGCAVCFGDPQSPMAKGLSAGVLALVSVVAFVLSCLAAVLLVWSWRSRSQYAGAIEEAPAGETAC